MRKFLTISLIMLSGLERGATAGMVAIEGSRNKQNKTNDLGFQMHRILPIDEKKIGFHIPQSTIYLSQAALCPARFRRHRTHCDSRFELSDLQFRD